MEGKHSTPVPVILGHEHTTMRVRDGVPFEQPALAGGGVKTGLAAALNPAKAEPGSTVAS